MKKILLTVPVLIFISSLCFAQQVSVSQAVLKPVETESFVGKIDSITLADVTKGTHLAIAVVDGKGQKMNFAVKVNTVISAKDGKKLTFSSLKKDYRIIVEYATTEKYTNIAQSIKLVDEKPELTNYISEKAKELWEKDGRKQGLDLYYWSQAEKIVKGQTEK